VPEDGLGKRAGNSFDQRGPSGRHGRADRPLGVLMRDAASMRPTLARLRRGAVRLRHPGAGRQQNPLRRPALLPVHERRPSFASQWHRRAFAGDRISAAHGELSLSARNDPAFDAQADPAGAWVEGRRTESHMNFSARPATRSRRLVAPSDRPARFLNRISQPSAPAGRRQPACRRRSEGGPTPTDSRPACGCPTWLA